MMMNNWRKKMNNQRGGALILTMVIISVIIFTFISVATFSLSQTIIHLQRSNAKIQQIEVAQDLSQAVARAYTLGRETAGVCPTGTTLFTESSINFCFPTAGVLGLGGTGLTGVCVDLDQNATSTNDRYCIQTLTRVTKWSEPNGESPSYIATIREKISNKFISMVLAIDSAFAQCTWVGCPEPAHGAAEGTPASVTSITPPAAFTPEPAGAAVVATGGALASNNTLEPWFPTPAWANTNEVYTPNCTAANQYWLGCVNCALAAFQCFEFTICPVGETTCTIASGNLMTQGVAFY